MRIDCYISPSCSSKEPLKKNIHKALELEKIYAEVTFSVINELEAARLGLKGSPSVFIDGKDIQPIETPGFV
jgi:hypothetical protein